jgi:pectinesterase
MAVENPSKEIITAINSAVIWFEKTKQELKKSVRGLEYKVFDKVMVKDLNAAPLWARFMGG